MQRLHSSSLGHGNFFSHLLLFLHNAHVLGPWLHPSPIRPCRPLLLLLIITITTTTILVLVSRCRAVPCLIYSPLLHVHYIHPIRAGMTNAPRSHFHK